MSYPDNLKLRAAHRMSVPPRSDGPGLTRTDVRDLENILDAQHQLRRCVTEADYAAWATTWGDSFVIDAINRKSR